MPHLSVSLKQDAMLPPGGAGTESPADDFLGAIIQPPQVRSLFKAVTEFQSSGVKRLEFVTLSPRNNS